MFSKLTPASLCVCPTSFPTANHTKMIDTQMKATEAAIAAMVRDKDPTAAVLGGGGGGGDGKMAMANGRQLDNGRNHLHAPTTRANGVHARHHTPSPPADINCNRTTTTTATTRTPKLEPPGRAQPQFNRVMSAVNPKRSPKSLDIRKEEVMAIRNRFPTKVPIIVQRFCKETVLPQLDKSKYLVPQEITMSQFLTIIRNRMRISSTQTLYLLVNNRSMISLSLTLAEAYNDYAGSDGFLYVTYASQEVFGCLYTIDEDRLLHQEDSTKQKKHKVENLTTPNWSNKLIYKTQHVMMNANEGHFDGFLDNTYKSMCFG